MQHELSNFQVIARASYSFEFIVDLLLVLSYNSIFTFWIFLFTFTFLSWGVTSACTHNTNLKTYEPSNIKLRHLANAATRASGLIEIDFTTNCRLQILNRHQWTQEIRAWLNSWQFKPTTATPQSARERNMDTNGIRANSEYFQAEFE